MANIIFYAYPELGVAWTFGEAAMAGGAAIIAVSGMFFGLAAAIPHGHGTKDINSGIADDDDGGEFSGKPIGPGDPDRFRPAMAHTTDQEHYVSHANERVSDRHHYFNLLCRRFYHNQRRYLQTHPEKYALALFYFARKFYRWHRHAFRRSDIIEPSWPNAFDFANARLLREARRQRARKRGREFLAS